MNASYALTRGGFACPAFLRELELEMANNHYEKLYASAPINKLAATVTYAGQDLDCEIDKLIDKYNTLRKAIKAAKQNKNLSLQNVKDMGQELQGLQDKISALKGRRKYMTQRILEKCFMDVCREAMHTETFYKFLKMAKERQLKNKTD